MTKPTKTTKRYQPYNRPERVLTRSQARSCKFTFHERELTPSWRGRRFWARRLLARRRELGRGAHGVCFW